ncbi:MAG: hypothetical protein IJZ29_00775 [Clostridia bacterium]|nr:hypothetical protein [Clostridia bacterium]
MLNLGVSSVLAVSIADAVLNVLAIIGIVCLGAFIIVFICDLILSISGNKNGIFFKKKETIYEEEPKQEKSVEPEMVENYSFREDRMATIEERQTAIDMQKAEEEERELREKLALNGQNDFDFEDDEEEQDGRNTDLEEKNAELLRLLEEKDESFDDEDEEETVKSSFLSDIQDEEDDYDDIIAAINKMREEEDAIVDDGVQEETIIDNSDIDEDTIIFEELEAEENATVMPTVEESTTASDVRDDVYYKTLSEEIAELKKELEEQKRIMELDKLEAQEREDALRKENEQLAEELEDAKQVQETVAVEVSSILLTEQEYNERLEMLKERLKENDKQLRKIKKEYKPLERVVKTLERDKEKLRRKEAIVAKQKIVLYGVNNYIDIDEEKAQKLAEDLDLLDGLRLSVQHCEEVMEANKDRYPILEQTYNILLNNSEQINADIKQLEEDLAKLKANESNGDEDAHQEMFETAENVVASEEFAEVEIDTENQDAEMYTEESSTLSEEVEVNENQEEAVEETNEEVVSETVEDEEVASSEDVDMQEQEVEEDVLHDQISIEELEEQIEAQENINLTSEEAILEINFDDEDDEDKRN